MENTLDQSEKFLTRMERLSKRSKTRGTLDVPKLILTRAQEIIPDLILTDFTNKDKDWTRHIRGGRELPCIQNMAIT